MTSLAAIRERLAAATPGPWEAVIGQEFGEFNTLLSTYPEGVRETASGEALWVTRFDDDYGTDSMANATFIAHAREDIEALLRVAEAAQEAVEYQNAHGRHLDTYTLEFPLKALATALDSLHPPERNEVAKR